MGDLRELRVIHVAPRSGTSGVGDYADDFVAVVRPQVGEVVEVRHGGPGEDRLVDVLRLRRRLRALVSESSRPTVVHAELSAGAVAPFWATRGLGDRLTATLHDAPWPVWFPWRVRTVSRSYVLNHGLHLTTRRLTERMERRLARGDRLFAMTRAGTDAAAAALPGARVSFAGHVLARRGDLPEAEVRPRAVGMFGYAYGDKGRDLLVALRAALDPSIDLVVAGRGTQRLTPVAGVRILGPVEGAEQDAFFASVRLLVMPHGERGSYGRRAFQSSGVLANSLAYATPVVRAGRDFDGEALGVLDVPTDAGRIAAMVHAVLDDPQRLAALGQDVRSARAQQSGPAAVADYLAAWQEAVS